MNGNESEELIKFVRNFIKTHEISSGESIYQVDSISLALPEFLEGCCEIVGYHKYEE